MRRGIPAEVGNGAIASNSYDGQLAETTNMLQIQVTTNATHDGKRSVRLLPHQRLLWVPACYKAVPIAAQQSAIAY